MKLKEIIEKEFKKGGDVDMFVLANLLRNENLSDEGRKEKHDQFMYLGDLLKVSAEVIDQSADMTNMKLMDIDKLAAIAAGYEVTVEIIGKTLESVSHMVAKDVTPEKALEIINSKKDLLKGYLNACMPSIQTIDVSAIMKMKKNEEDKGEGYSNS